MATENTSHPTYNNPAIVEAVCEIRLESGKSSNWDTNNFSKFKQLVSSDYPEESPVQQHSVEIQFGPAGAKRAVEIEQRMMYRNADRTRLLQFGPSGLIVNFLPKYNGWKHFECEIINRCGQACAIHGRDQIYKVGLRYINKLPPISRNETLSKWLRASDYLPQSLTSKPAGFLRLETFSANGVKAVLTVGKNESLSNADNRIFMLDIDCIMEISGGAPSSDIKRILNLLHDESWNIFSGAKTDEFEVFLREGAGNEY